MSSPVVPAPEGFITFTRAGFDEIIAPILVGWILSNCLFGINMMQFYLCSVAVKGREKVNRFTIYLLFLLLASELVDSGFKNWFAVEYLKNIISRGYAGVIVMPHSDFSVPIIDGWIASLNHFVYGYRLWTLTKKKTVTFYGILGICGALSLVNLAFSIDNSIRTRKAVSNWLPYLYVPGALWMCSAALADFILCGAFIYQLKKHRDTSDFKTTRQMLSRYIVLSLETGLIGAILQILTIILWFSYPAEDYEIVLVYFLPKVYIAAMLLVLVNSLQGSAKREKSTVNSANLRSNGSGGGVTSGGPGMMSTGGRGLSDKSITHPAGVHQGVRVHVLTTKSGDNTSNGAYELDNVEKGYPAAGYGGPGYDFEPQTQSRGY